MHRTGQEVASQAIIFGTLGFRASLEVTEHARSAALCSQLMPWIEQVHLDARISDFHREILETPHQKLPRESQTEAYWRGEAAAVLGWAIQVCDRLNPTRSTDPGFVVSSLRILQQNASELISSASLRPQPEIDEYCAFCLTVRHQCQVAVLQQDGRAALQRIHLSRLAELGLSDAFRRLNATELEAVTNCSQASIKGLYVVRGITAEWLLDKDA